MALHRIANMVETDADLLAKFFNNIGQSDLHDVRQTLALFEIEMFHQVRGNSLVRVKFNRKNSAKQGRVSKFI